MKRLNEKQEQIFLEEEKALKLFEEVCRTDVWKNCYTSEIQAIPIDDAPILMQEIRRKWNIAAEVSDDSMTENMEDLRIGLSIPFDTCKQSYPLGDTAYASLIQRAGFGSSPVLLNLTDKTSQKSMSPLARATVLNEGIKLFNNKALVLIRDEKVRAVLSGDESDYSVIPFDQVVSVLKTYLIGQFQAVKFESAFASHMHFGATYVIKDKNLIGNVETIFSNAGVNVGTMKAAIRLISSDVGMSGVNLYPYVHGSGRTFMIGTPISLTHKNRNGLGEFANNCTKIMATFKESESKLQDMETKPVKNVSGMFLRIAKQAGLPKKMCCEKAEALEIMYGSNAKQIDLFSALYEVLEDYDAEKMLSNDRRLTLEEGISRIVFSRMEDFDLPFQWE